eukprot:gnl/MRDRNA2_/MRDRNA2_87130_c0_seq1.p1 gnl/MRDRNA2_/MRDRNA2_87130_c0~~gnl/MRDRNA2_/MRDRNA2_87130_c0_seq1.p1  ORF type:complete len:145 (+),score=21.83 gnl/MRDRNA2_/MRDRNA2_87130_c0_seq1:84-518(+)
MAHTLTFHLVVSVAAGTTIAGPIRTGVPMRVGSVGPALPALQETKCKIAAANLVVEDPPEQSLDSDEKYISRGSQHPIGTASSRSYVKRVQPANSRRAITPEDTSLILCFVFGFGMTCLVRTIVAHARTFLDAGGARGISTEND